jgi:hypothetical protein
MGAGKSAHILLRYFEWGRGLLIGGIGEADDKTT